MNIFNCTPEQLAPYFSRNPGSYDTLKSFLLESKEKNMLSREVESGLEETLETLENANDIARNGEYFAFSIYDSWAADHDESSEGIVIYQQAGKEMVEKISVDAGGACPIDRAIEILKERGINRVLTTPVPYLGVDDWTDADGDSLTYKVLEENQVEMFKDNGIEVVYVANS